MASKDFANFRFYFKDSKTLHVCNRLYLGTLQCRASSEANPNDYHSYYYKVTHPEKYMSISEAPNGKDVWMSGGRGIRLMDAIGIRVKSVFIDDGITVIRDQSFTLHEGPKLPKPLMGHCIVSIGMGRLFLFGGISVNGTTGLNLVPYKGAWIWHDSTQTWEMVSPPSPCPLEQHLPDVQQQCAVRSLKAEELQVVTRNTNCTAIFNVKTMKWSKPIISALPIGGYLIRGHDKAQVFYVGGIKSTSVYELMSNHLWQLSDLKLPFTMSLYDTVFTNVGLNITDCSSDSRVVQMF